jgi:hypothetical protein
MRMSGTVLIQYIHMRARVCVSDISQVFHRLISVWPTHSDCTGEYSATATRAAVTRVHGGANLNWGNFNLGNFFTPFHRVAADKILCTIITR